MKEDWDVEHIGNIYIGKNIYEQFLCLLQRKFNVQKALVENNLTITIFDLRRGLS